LIYDDVNDITWIQDAQYVYNTLGYPNSGRMSWYDAVDLANNLIYTNSGGTYSDWRLPKTAVPDATCSGHPYPHGSGCENSEMGHLFNVLGINFWNAESALPFINVGAGEAASNGYWTGTTITLPDLPDDAHWFHMSSGSQWGYGSKTSSLRVWPVRDGDVAFALPFTTVDIHVYPLKTNRRVHPHHNGTVSAIGGLNDSIRVFVFGSSTDVGDFINFDTTTIDPNTVRFGPDSGGIDPDATVVLDNDYNNDGLLDARFHFLTGDAGIRCTDTEATITGETLAGDPFGGKDSIKTACNAQCH
jgi:hypothetical protein